MTELRYLVKKSYEKVDGIAAYVHRFNNALQFRHSFFVGEYKHWTEWQDVQLVEEDSK